MRYAISVLVIMATLVGSLLAVSVIGHWTRTDGQSIEQTDIQGKLSTTTPKDVEIRNNGLSTTGTCTVTVTYKNPAKVVTVVLEHGQDHKFDDPGLVKGDTVEISDESNDGGQTSSGGYTVFNP